MRNHAIAQSLADDLRNAKVQHLARTMARQQELETELRSISRRIEVETEAIARHDRWVDELLKNITEAQ